MGKKLLTPKNLMLAALAFWLYKEHEKSATTTAPAPAATPATPGT